MSNYRTYIIHTCGRNDELNAITEIAGRIYNKTVSLVRKVQDQKGFWLSVGNAKKYLRCLEYSCHAHSVQAIIDDYYSALCSFFSRRKRDPKSRPPYKTRKYHTFTWRATGISIQGDKMRLSMGKGREPVLIRVTKQFRKVPVEVSMIYNRQNHQFEFHATFQVKPTKHRPKKRSASAVDMGEIHPISAFDGQQAMIINGRFIRSIKQYRNKFLARINQKISRCKRGSHRWKTLKAAKNRVLTKIKNQIKDVEHKVTSFFVSACRVNRAQTIVLGDLKHIRQSIDYGKNANQKLHQWNFGKIRSMITYKAENVGIEVKTESEKYTSQTCPACKHKHKPSGRVYKCPKCKWTGHRDVVGASNIWTKYQGLAFNPVVGVLASPVGVRFSPHLRRLDSWSPFRGLISKKPVKNR